MGLGDWGLGVEVVAAEFVVEGLAGDAELGCCGGEVAAVVGKGFGYHAAFHLFEGGGRGVGCLG